jgi:hypothetical protein
MGFMLLEQVQSKTKCGFFSNAGKPGDFRDCVFN